MKLITNPTTLSILVASAAVFTLGVVTVLTLYTATKPSFVLQDATSVYRMQDLSIWLRNYFGLWWPYVFLVISFLVALIWILGHFWYSSSDAPIHIDATEAWHFEIMFGLLSFVLATTVSVLAVHLFLQNSTNPLRLNQNGSSYAGPSVSTSRNSRILLLVGGGVTILFAVPVIAYVLYGFVVQNNWLR